MTSWLVRSSPKSDLGSSPGHGHDIGFLGKSQYSLSASVSTQVYKQALANIMLGKSYNVQTSIPSRGEKEYS